MQRFNLGAEFHDIAPPVDYSLIPPWLIAAGVLAGVIVIALVIRAALRARQRTRPQIPPREKAINELERLRTHVDHLSAYEFSIRASDIVRQFVHEQFSLPVTRQTSIEFLNSIGLARQFNPDEKALLAAFLDRCDLIKFARLDATTADSRQLLEDAQRFVKGGNVVAA